MSSKILALNDVLGNLVKFILMPGQRHDIMGVKELICDVRFGALLAVLCFLSVLLYRIYPENLTDIRSGGFAGPTT